VGTDLSANHLCYVCSMVHAGNVPQTVKLPKPCADGSPFQTFGSCNEEAKDVVILSRKLGVQLASQAREQACSCSTIRLWILTVDKPQQNNRIKIANTISFTN